MFIRGYTYLILPIRAQVKKKDGQLLMTGKAYNNRCIVEWLHDVVRRHYQNSGDPRMPAAYLCLTLSQHLPTFC